MHSSNLFWQFSFVWRKARETHLNMWHKKIVQPAWKCYSMNAHLLLEINTAILFAVGGEKYLYSLWHKLPGLCITVYSLVMVSMETCFGKTNRKQPKIFLRLTRFFSITVSTISIVCVAPPNTIHFHGSNICRVKWSHQLLACHWDPH